MAMRYAGQGGITATCLWYKFFKEIDEDGSGRMMYDELVKMARIHLRMPETQVSDTQLQEVWRALDQDNSGYINAGEFGRFMRLGRERCAQCIAGRLPGAAQALVREDTQMSIGVDAAEEARRYSISHTVAGPARCCPPSPHHPLPHVPLLTPPPHPLRTHPPRTLHAPSSHPPRTLLTPSTHTRTHPPHTLHTGTVERRCSRRSRTRRSATWTRRRG